MGPNAQRCKRMTLYEMPINTQFNHKLNNYRGVNK